MESINEIVSPCGHPFEKIVRHGNRYNKSRLTQKYLCLQCGKHFSFGPLKQKKLTYELWKFVTNLHSNGYSTREIKVEIYKKFNIKISHTGVWRWIETNPDILRPTQFENDFMEYQKKKQLKKIQTMKIQILKTEKTKKKLLEKIASTERKLKIMKENILNGV